VRRPYSRGSGGVKRDIDLGLMHIFIASIAFPDGFERYFLRLLYAFLMNSK
jgi:hypothetical protein